MGMRDLTGRVFGRLRVIKRIENRGCSAYWLARCVCGNEKEVRGEHLLSGGSRSCGCLNSETTAARNRTHGMYGTPPYNSWAHLCQRCCNPDDKNYDNYGGRGISVCGEWRGSFEAFWRDMGPSYREGLTIDRIDNDGGYCKKNCRWATALTQGRNRRITRFVTFAGESIPAAVAAERAGIPFSRVSGRLKNGCIDQDLFRPRYSRREAV